MLASRWENENVAEKSSILFTAFIVYLFGLSTLPVEELLVVMAIFFAFEIFTDILLVYVFDRFFGVPFLRLERKSWKAFAAEMAIFSQASMSVALALKVARNVVFFQT